MRTFVLFDFDGVIADSYALSFEVAKIVHPHLTEEAYVPMWDGNIFSEAKMAHCTPECRDHDFYNEYSPRAGTIQLIPGAAAFLDTLAARHQLVVISSSITTDVMQIATRNGIAHYFSDVLGKDVHTSKVEKIHTILDRYEARTDDCVFVTDTLGDMKEASGVGVGIIGVGWGFQPRERLERGSAFRIVDTPAELPDAIEDYFTRQQVVHNESLRRV